MLTGEGERARRAALAAAAEIEGRAEGAAAKAKREAIAEAVEREGHAEAEAIRAKGEAEAEAMAKKADSFERYGEAAVLDLVAEMLPDLVRSAAEPIGKIANLTVISTEGASQLTRTVTSNIAQGLQIAGDLTGIDLRTVFGKAADKATEASARAASQDVAAEDDEAPHRSGSLFTRGGAQPTGEEPAGE
jgi:flotillin